MSTLSPGLITETPEPTRPQFQRLHVLECGAGCRSRKFPVGRGGAPMPYCIYFHNDQALHGSHQVVRKNVSHGCVRLHIKDAKWLRFNFAEEPTSSKGPLGTIVIIKPY